MNNAVLPTGLNDLGLWLGFIISLLIFSALLGDHLLARLAQYILVGVSVGYLGVLATQYALRPLVIVVQGRSDWWDWLLLSLSLVLLIAGLLRMVLPAPSGAVQPRWSLFFQRLGAFPLAFMLGIGITITLIGSIQGTLAPQAWRVATNGLDWQSPPGQLIAGLLGLILTSAVMLHLSLDPQIHLANQPLLLRRLMEGWIWIGQRALWLAAGVLFARLFASRYSLLIGQMVFWQDRLVRTGLWEWAEGVLTLQWF